MSNKEAVYILRNAAWLGTNEDREKIENAVEVVANALNVNNDSILEDTRWEKDLFIKHLN